ncbi:gamma-glutamyltransferase [Pseudoalteromonas sp. SSDWG2]|uniref:gamma-glutamyltransferase n=1 Tax=Pseudoalteromonas sp. SSDWG2 TaxID=3139391 RepID=UPI003BA86D20
MTFPKTILSLTLTILLSASCTAATPTKPNQVLADREPEATTSVVVKQQVEGSKYMVAAANPHAVRAGEAVLAKGGSAIDAAIAVQLVLTLTEPQSSGIGGGAFIMHYDNATKHLTSFDGRETAPSKATPELFLDGTGKAVPWIDAVVGGRSVGVPGVLKALADAHEKYGTLPWEELFTDAIKLSDQGFKVSPRLHGLIAKRINPGVELMPKAKAYFFPNGQPLAIGTIRKNPELAQLYKRIATQGVSAFYSGENAKAIVEAVNNSPIAPGVLSIDDLASYQAKERAPICVGYHAYRVCSMAPPSSGGMAVLQILKFLEDKKLSQYAPNDPVALHYFTQASRLAFADRAVFMGDPDFQPVPTQALLDEQYMDTRAALITEQDKKQKHGNPMTGAAYAQDDSYELPNTSHISIIDASGNAVSMTTSIEMAFGSTVMANGYLLNNQLTDFALSPKRDGKYVMNRVEGGKRPRSSMSPVIVFNSDGSIRLVIGSPGGSRIINYVAHSIVGVLDWGLSAQDAINLPRITNRNDKTTLEQGTELAAQKEEFEKRGHSVYVGDLNSGIHAVEIINGKLYGAADPRREGIALGK